MTVPTDAGPTLDAERALAPDLARGVMLLFIALANTHFFLPGEASTIGWTNFAGFPYEMGVLDRATAWLISTFVDERAYPMFGVLFGYGVARIAARQIGATPKAVRHRLWRRAAFLIVVGALHGLLLFVGDILAAYGVLLLLGAWAVRWRDGTLLAVAAAFLVLVALPDPDSLSVSLSYDTSMLSQDFVGQLRERIEVTPWIAVAAPFGFACPFLVGLWAGRRRILERPADHRALLATVAAVGIVSAVLGAQPVALAVAHLTPLPGEEAMSWMQPLHTASGVLGGFGYAALIALVADRFVARPGDAASTPHGTHAPVAAVPGPVVRALAATGQRSMTCYLAQSVVWFVVFTPYLLDLSTDLGVTATALLACCTWLATVWLGDRMRAAGRRGPVETFARRATYGAGAAAASSTPQR